MSAQQVLYFSEAKFLLVRVAEDCYYPLPVGVATSFTGETEHEVITNFIQTINQGAEYATLTVDELEEREINVEEMTDITSQYIGNTQDSETLFTSIITSDHPEGFSVTGYILDNHKVIPMMDNGRGTPTVILGSFNDYVQTDLSAIPEQAIDITQSMLSKHPELHQYKSPTQSN